MILNDLDLQLNYFLNKNIDINIILNSQLIQLRNNEEKIYNYLNEYNKITQNKSTDYNLTIKDFYNNIDDKQNIKFKEFYVKYSFIFIFFIIFRSYINDINNFKILNNNIILIYFIYYILKQSLTLLIDLSSSPGTIKCSISFNILSISSISKSFSNPLIIFFKSL